MTKNIKKALLIFLFQLVEIIIITTVGFISGFSFVIFIVPVTDVFFKILISKKLYTVTISIVCFSWLISFMFMICGAVYMLSNQSDIGIMLMVMLHLYGFSLPDIIYIIISLLQTKMQQNK